MFSAYLGALGNRAWGADVPPRWVGVIFMTFALVISLKMALWTLPVTAFLVLVFRVSGSGPWLNMTEAPKVNWKQSFLRSSHIIPLSLFLFVVTGGPIHLILGALATLLIPALYYIAGKFKNLDSTALAEVLVGALVGIL